MIIRSHRTAKPVLYAGLAIIIAALTVTAINKAGVELTAGPVVITAGGDPGGMTTEWRETSGFYLTINLPGNRRIKIK